MLCDMAEGKKEIDPAFIREALVSGNTWAIPFEMQCLSGEDTPEYVNEVCETLDMYQSLESSYDSLSKADKAKVDASPVGSLVKFPGFDGNHEGEHMSAMIMLVRHLGRYSYFTGRENLNSHMSTVPGNEKMYKAWSATDGGYDLSADTIIEILKSRLS